MLDATRKKTPAAATITPLTLSAVDSDVASLSRPSSGGAARNPTSPAERYIATAMPRMCAGAMSATYAAGAGPAVPVPKLRTTLPITKPMTLDVWATTSAPMPAITPENRMTLRRPIESEAHAAGMSVKRVMTPVAVKTTPISAGPQPSASSACSGIRVARVPARVMKIVALTRAMSMNWRPSRNDMALMGSDPSSGPVSSCAMSFVSGRRIAA